MSIRNYKTIARVVQAVQFDGSNESFDLVRELAGSYITDGTIQVVAGEWVVNKGDGEFTVMTDEEFQLNYRLSK